MPYTTELLQRAGTDHAHPEQPAWHAWPGGYELVFTAADGGTLCTHCAHGENGSECASTDPDYADDPQWTLVDAFIHYEGGDLQCDHCNRLIPSEYGNPEDPDDA